jgi:hypothetical protein
MQPHMNAPQSVTVPQIDGSWWEESPVRFPEDFLPALNGFLPPQVYAGYIRRTNEASKVPNRFLIPIAAFIWWAAGAGILVGMVLSNAIGMAPFVLPMPTIVWVVISIGLYKQVAARVDLRRAEKVQATLRAINLELMQAGLRIEFSYQAATRFVGGGLTVHLRPQDGFVPPPTMVMPSAPALGMGMPMPLNPPGWVPPARAPEPAMYSPPNYKESEGATRIHIQEREGTAAGQGEWSQTGEGANVAYQPSAQVIPLPPIRFCPSCGSSLTWLHTADGRAQPPKFCAGCGYNL